MNDRTKLSLLGAAAVPTGGCRLLIAVLAVLLTAGCNSMSSNEGGSVAIKQETKSTYLDEQGKPTKIEEKKVEGKATAGSAKAAGEGKISTDFAGGKPELKLADLAGSGGESKSHAQVVPSHVLFWGFIGCGIVAGLLAAFALYRGLVQQAIILGVESGILFACAWHPVLVYAIVLYTVCKGVPNLLSAMSGAKVKDALLELNEQVFQSPPEVKGVINEKLNRHAPEAVKKTINSLLVADRIGTAQV